jgi:hypothetical protein
MFQQLETTNRTVRRVELAALTSLGAVGIYTLYNLFTSNAHKQTERHRANIFTTLPNLSIQTLIDRDRLEFRDSIIDYSGSAEHIKTNLLVDYAPLVKREEDRQGQIECNFAYLTRNDCDLSMPYDTCKQCLGFRRCQYIPGGVDYTENGGVTILEHLDMPTENGRGRCLPEQLEFKCNPYVGTPLLSKHGGQVFWLCIEQFPGLVAKTSMFGEPDTVIACGEHMGMGTLVHPITFRPWREERDYIPTLASCNCNRPFVAKYDIDGRALQCISDYCAPGLNDGNVDGSCSCPSGYVSCPSSPALGIVETRYLCPLAIEFEYETCVPDPCAPLGAFNAVTNKCELLASAGVAVALMTTRLVPRGLPYHTSSFAPCGGIGLTYTGCSAFKYYNLREPSSSSAVPAILPNNKNANEGTK